MDVAVNADILEQALLIGPRKSMVGVLSLPAAATARPDAPAVVLLNAGIIHRVGPNRMNVELARRLARLGYLVLRFDLSGIGDSEPRDDGLPPFEAALADIGEAIEWLDSTRQVRRVVLIGLCSGADHALLYASKDPRVVGLGLLDASIPRTSGYFMRHWSRRVVSLRVWTNVLTGRHAMWQRLTKALRLHQAPAPQPTESDDPAGVPKLESPEVRAILQSAYQKSLDHGARVLAVFAGTAGREYRLNYREQMLDAFPDVQFGDRLRLEYFKESDHTFTAECHRTALMNVICDWVASLQSPRTPIRQVVAGLIAASVALVFNDP
jgi:pimeloyl-ACP methyl ester carboxylesterase